MAAAQVLAPSQGRDRYFKLGVLLIDGGTQIIRGLFDSIHHPSNLVNALQINQGVLQRLRRQRILSEVEWKFLFPRTSSGTSSYGKSEDFDLALLFKLLRSICNLTEPATGWDYLPHDGDTCLEADVTRVKYHRNNTYAHIRSRMELSVDEFDKCWNQLRGALLRIVVHSAPTTVKEWEEEIEKCRTGPITEEDRTRCLCVYPVIAVKCILKIAMTGLFVTLNILEHDKVGHEALMNLIQDTLFPTQRITVESIHEGSIVIQLRVKSIEDLEDLWKRYQSGKLQNTLENIFVTDEVKKLSEKPELTVFKVTISKDDYLHARCILEELEPYKKQESISAAEFEVEKKVEETAEKLKGLSLDIDEVISRKDYFLSEQRVVEFVEKYFKENYEMKLKALAFIKGNNLFMSLCEVPLLCLSICVFIENNLKKSMEGFSYTLTQLFSELTQYIQQFSRRASLSKTTVSIDLQDKLCELAAKLFLEGKSSFKEEDLKELNLSEEECSQLRSSCFLSEISVKTQSFIDQSIQKYLSACYFVKAGEIPEKELRSLSKKHLFLPSMANVLVFMAGSMDPEKDETLMNKLLEQLAVLEQNSVIKRSILLSCLHEYCDKQFVQKVISGNQNNIIWDERGFISLINIDYNVVAMLVENLPSSSAHDLHIFNSPLTVLGVTTLFTALSKQSCRVTSLTLNFCAIDVNCTEYLGTYLVRTSISHLSLVHNSVTDRVALSLLSYCDKLKVLVLHSYKIPKESAKQVAKSFKDKYPNLDVEIS